ncbi:Snf7-domain-containing protein [Phakopsora pachyrhizi]|uniref:Snf7-domain-containing protein n=1 Tax=Phakopsora pachyrhizi TaxID=170000 RepID=A0AAV0AHU5_PHAPC|nr:Snf7-domain-containing protein [Phakopsora pachyrhizi]CAH7666763.1 Snf7-domain-containing protein [Phakopsora pachyrhizi]
MNIIETVFGRYKSPAERMREHQRSLQKAIRELDRERSKLETQEKKLVADIKSNAKKGQMSSCKVMARDLVRTRRYVSKFCSMRTQLQAVSLRLQSMRSNQQMAEAMRGATRAMGMMSRTMNMPQIQKILMEFEKESSMMDMKEEMMNEAVDDAMEDNEEETEEEEGDKILQEVLDDIGINLSQKLGDTPVGLESPSAAPEIRQAVAVGESSGAGNSSNPAVSDLDDFSARLASLRRD